MTDAEQSSPVPRQVDVSVVIVNWNTRDLLLDCIKSLYSETRSSSLQIIVVDNASEDGSADAVAEAFPDVTLIRNDINVGFSRANNQGLAVAEGRYLCLVNSDVKALDGVIDLMRAYLEAHPDIGALAPRTIGADLRLRRNCRDYPTLRNEASQALYLDRLFPSVRAFRGRTLQDYDYQTPSDIEVLSGCFLMVPRRVWQVVGGLDERFFIYAEDTDWCRRISEAGWRVVYFPPAQAIHYGGSSSGVERIRFDQERIRANLQYWRKHEGAVRTTAYWGLQLVGTALRATGWSLASVARQADGREQARTAARRYWHVTRWVMGEPGRSGDTARRGAGRDG